MEWWCIDSSKEKRIFLLQVTAYIYQGSCKIAKIENTNQNIVYFINLNSFYYTLTKNTHFVRLVYDDTMSYLFPHFDNGLSSLTLLKASPLLHNFEEILTYFYA